MCCNLEKDVNDVIKVAFGYLQRPGIKNSVEFGNLDSPNLFYKKRAYVKDILVQV